MIESERDAPRVRRLANGVTVVVEPSGRGGSPSTEFTSTGIVATEVVVRAGAVHDPAELPGATTLLFAWTARGAAGRSARERQDAFARLGARNGGGAGRDRSVLSLRAPSDGWPQALEWLASELAAPDLDDATFEVARLHSLHDRAARDDDPAARLDVRLTEATLAPPFDRDPYGGEEALRAATPEAVRAHARSCLRPDRVTVIVTGAADSDAAADAVEAAFDSWRAPDGPAPHDAEPAFAPPTRRRLPDPDLQQVQLGFGWPLLPAHDPRSAAQGLGLAVLSEGTGSRLFARIRERLGLAYAVHARAVAVPGLAWGEAFAAVRPERADRAEEAILEELTGLARGVTAPELERARTQLRTQDAMRGETAGGRAAQIVRDLVLLGRVRTPERREHDLRTPDLNAVNDALAASPCCTPAVVTLGGSGS